MLNHFGISVQALPQKRLQEKVDKNPISETEEMNESC